jgi:aspartate beta-hydroxylase
MFWEMLEEDLEQEVVPEFGREALERVFEFVKYCKYEKDIPELPEFQEIDPEFFPGMTAKPWWDTKDCGEWVEKVIEGLPYVQGELADLLEDNEESLISDSVQNQVMGAGWSGFRLQRLGYWVEKNVAQFPQTVQLLKDAGTPLAMRGVIVARQIPGSGVAPHSDGRNFFLTAHFGLSIPEDCAMTCGGIEKEWEEDGCIVLDTSFKHSTRNDSDEDRFVLIVDFWHPDLTVPEREALEYIYDFRGKWEQGKIEYIPKHPTEFWETFEFYAPWGSAYTEETTGNWRMTGDENETPWGR